MKSNQRATIETLLERNTPQREIARITGIDRKTIRSYRQRWLEQLQIEIGQLPMTYQKAIGNDKVEAVPTGDTSHRGTFATAVPQWKAWFDGQ